MLLKCMMWISLFIDFDPLQDFQYVYFIEGMTIAANSMIGQPFLDLMCLTYTTLET